jgi:NADH:ubiquinone oxidoreductase subunit H
VYIFSFFFLPSSLLLLISVSLFVSFVFIWIRITFCRFRYDMLIITAWKVLLPLSLCAFVVFLFLSF